jgi:hypothetical protein
MEDAIFGTFLLNFSKWGSIGPDSRIANRGAFHNWGGRSTGVMKEPDNYGGTQHHAAIALSGWPNGTTMLGIAGEWNDINSASLLYFVIEKDSGSIGMNTHPEGRTLESWPNPVRDNLYLSEECSLVEVFSTCGSLLATYHNSRSIPLRTLGKNLYIIRFYNNNSVNTRLIMVMPE